MENLKVLEQKITKAITVKISSTREGNSLDSPIYAINWFNTKSRWIYDLYNLLAKNSVQKVGGRLFFKGNVIKTLKDDQNTDRKVLLIVRYSSPHKFMELIQGKFFQIISLLRKTAVDRFTFGFTDRLDQAGHEANDHQKVYAVHHFKSSDSVTQLQKIESYAKNQEVSLAYSGVTSSILSSENGDKEIKVPCLLDGILLFSSASQDTLADFLTSEDYQAVASELDSSYIGMVERVM